MPRFPDSEKLRKTALAAREAEEERTAAKAAESRRIARVEAANRRRHRLQKRDVLVQVRAALLRVVQSAAEGSHSAILTVPDSQADDVVEELSRRGIAVSLIDELTHACLLPRIQVLVMQIKDALASLERAPESTSADSEAVDDTSEIFDRFPDTPVTLSDIYECGGPEALTTLLGRRQSALASISRARAIDVQVNALQANSSEADKTTDRIADLILVLSQLRNLLFALSMARPAGAIASVADSDDDEESDDDEPELNTPSTAVLMGSWLATDLAESQVRCCFDSQFAGWIVSTGGQGLLAGIKASLVHAAESGLDRCDFVLARPHPNPLRWGPNIVNSVSYENRPLGIFPHGGALLQKLLNAIGFRCACVDEQGRQLIRIEWGEPSYIE